jgi:hypothetical protein
MHIAFSFDFNIRLVDVTAGYELMSPRRCKHIRNQTKPEQNFTGEPFEKAGVFSLILRGRAAEDPGKVRKASGLGTGFTQDLIKLSNTVLYLNRLCASEP